MSEFRVHITLIDENAHPYVEAVVHGLEELHQRACVGTDAPARERMEGAPAMSKGMIFWIGFIAAGALAEAINQIYKLYAVYCQ